MQKYSKQILTINNPQELFLTKEKKNLYVDFFIKWKIDNTQDYNRSTGGDELVASQRLLETVKDGIRSEFAKRTVVEVVSKERREIMSEMLNDAAMNARNLGINLIDVRVKRIELSDEVSESVYNRMRQERARFASEESVYLIEQINRKEITGVNSSKNHRIMLQSIEKLLNDCKIYGTIPFSRMARIAFISNIMLKSLTEIGKIDKKFEDVLMQSISTPLPKFQEDASNYIALNISRKEFLLFKINFNKRIQQNF